MGAICVVFIGSFEEGFCGSKFVWEFCVGFMLLVSVWILYIALETTMFAM